MARCDEQVWPHLRAYRSGIALIHQKVEKDEVCSLDAEDLCAHQKILGVVVRSVVWSSHTGYAD